jgi:multiple sugar transport system substrate-binding protein
MKTLRPDFHQAVTRRLLLHYAVHTGLGALPAACGLPGRRSESTARPRPAVTLEYWSRWGPPTAEVEEKRVEEYNAANAPTRVQRSTMTGDYIEKLNSAFAAGAGPDVYTVGGSGIPNFSAKGAALTLGNYPAVQKELPDFFPATIEASMYQGRLNGLPYIADVRAMIYRKDFMAEVGLDPERFPDTWEVFREAARRLTKREGQTLTRVGFDVPKQGWPAHDLFIVLHVQQGERPFSADLTRATFAGAAGMQALQLMVDLVHKDQVDAFNRPGAPSGVHPLAAGVHASTWSSAGPVNNARRTTPEMLAQIGTAPIPRLNQRFTYMGGTYLMASSKPKDALMVVDFILFLTAARHADEICSIQSAIPPRKSAGFSPYVQDPLIKTFYDAVQYSWSYPNHPYYTEIRDLIAAEIGAAMSLQKSIRAALDEAARAAQEYLSRS